MDVDRIGVPVLLPLLKLAVLADLVVRERGIKFTGAIKHPSAKVGGGRPSGSQVLIG